jgi:hypothetical protein
MVFSLQFSFQDFGDGDADHDRENGSARPGLDFNNTDLDRRNVKNREQMKAKRAIERYVLDLDIDWEAFHHRLSETLMGCDHSHTVSRDILASMGLGDEVIEACVHYLCLQGGFCDCEVIFNFDVAEPRPIVDFSCKDCGCDYDESYMVHKKLWKAHGVGDDHLCIGCLEKRMGRQLRRQDFTDAPINEIDAQMSLRLQDRLSNC